MSWGTDFTADLFLNRLTFNNTFELEDKIKEIEDDISNIKSNILMYCAATPSKDLFPDEDGVNVLNDIKINVIDLFNELEDNLHTLFLLKEYKNYIEENKIDLKNKKEIEE